MYFVEIHQNMYTILPCSFGNMSKNTKKIKCVKNNKKTKCSRMSTVKMVYIFWCISTKYIQKKLLISHVVHRKKYFSSEIIVCVFLLFFLFFLLFFHTFYFFCVFSTCSRMSTVKWYTYFDVSRRKYIQKNYLLVT